MEDERGLRREVKRLEFELRASLESVPLLRAMVDGSRDGVALFDDGGGLLEHNRAFADMVRGEAGAGETLRRGADVNALLGPVPGEPPLWPPEHWPGEPRIARSRGADGPEVAGEGARATLEVLLTPVGLGAARRVWVANARALTDATLQARALVEARRRVEALTVELGEQQRFAALFEHSPDALLLVGFEGKLLLRSRLAAAWWPTLGVGADVTPDLPEIAPALEGALSGAEGAAKDAAWCHEGAMGVVHVLATVVPMTLADGPGALVVARDVTAQELAEQALEGALAQTSAALAEREVLLREIHHRVKNNLQIISSLLGMQADGAAPEAASALGESALRVRSMALVHELLYGGEDLAHVEFSRYVETLAFELAGALCPEAKLTLELDPVELVIDQAIPAGLILNELLTNAFKHGRAPDGCCCITVRASLEGAGRMRLGVADGGPGLPPDYATRRAGSLGMTIANALARQLGGELVIEPGPGARFSLSFPVA
jgi:two-component sensor histidine kinase